MAILDKDGKLISDHYPRNWDEFIGQDPAKRDLKVGVAAARARGKTMGHVLLASPMPGIGKTSMALLTATGLGGRIRLHSGPVPANKLPYLVGDLEEGDVLFLDEVHRLFQGAKGAGEWLLHLMQDGMITTPLGMQDIPPITVIAATTDAGRLPETIQDRFDGPRPSLVPYTDEEATRVAAQLARRVIVDDGFAAPTDAVCAAVARAGTNNPRLMRRVWCQVRDLLWAEQIQECDGDYPLSLALEMAGVTPDGLTSQAQRYLLIMLTEFHGNPAGERVLADRLGEVKAGLTMIERVLLDKQLIGLTKGGRMLTPDGMRRAKELAA